MQLVFLETENAKLKQQLKAALDEIKALKEQNLELRQQSPTKRKAELSLRMSEQADSVKEQTFVTKGSENPNMLCENW